MNPVATWIVFSVLTLLSATNACLGADPAAKASPGGANMPSSFRDCKDCPEMVMVPAGKFTMGRTVRDLYAELWDSDREEPPHEVTIARPFAVSKFEITTGQFAKFADASSETSSSCDVWRVNKGKKEGGDFHFVKVKNGQAPGFAQGSSHPAVCVSFDSATKYTQWLAKQTGKGYRLLSEAEWEYAARAGATGSYLWGETDASSRACRFANVSDRAFGRWSNGHLVAFSGCDDEQSNTAPVGTFAPNPFGLHDMIGNVMEWVEDCWHANYTGAPVDGSAWQGEKCTRRIVRGGSWFGGTLRHYAFSYRSYRGGQDERAHMDVGFRIARPAD